MKAVHLVGAVAVLAGLIVAPASSASAVPTAHGNGVAAVLRSGHCLVADRQSGSDELESRSGRLSLLLSRDGELDIDDYVESGRYYGQGGEGIWTAPRPEKLAQESTLCLGSGGDLVLRADKKRIWDTNTNHRAPGGQARMTDAGRLVVQTSHGRTVWSSRTTSVLFAPGDHLNSGSSLVNRTYPHSTTRLSMLISGDLVLRRNSAIVWHSRTHSRGSHLYLTHHGRLEIINDRGVTLWHSTAEGEHAILEVAQQGRLVLHTARYRRCWIRPVSTSQDCDAG